MSKQQTLQQLLQQHPFLQLQADRPKVHCQVTGRDVPADAQAVQQHLQSKKFKKMMEWYSADFSKYLPYIVPHKRDEKKMFCSLSKTMLNKIPAEIEKHVNGKRFQRLKEAAEEKKKRKGKARAEEGERKEELEFWMPDGYEEEEEEGAANDGEEDVEEEVEDEQEEEEEEDEDDEGDDEDYEDEEADEDESVEADDNDDDMVVVRKVATGKGGRVVRAVTPAAHAAEKSLNSKRARLDEGDDDDEDEDDEEEEEGKEEVQQKPQHQRKAQAKARAQPSKTAKPVKSQPAPKKAAQGKQQRAQASAAATTKSTTSGNQRKRARA